MHAIFKYENAFQNEKDDEKLLEFIKREMVRPKAVLDSSLSVKEAIEILKYLNRVDIAEKVLKIKAPHFDLNNQDLQNHRVLLKETNTYKDLEAYSKHIAQIRFNALLVNLKIKWIDSNFEITKSKLLELIDEEYLKKFLRDKITKKKTK